MQKKFRVYSIDHFRQRIIAFVATPTLHAPRKLGQMERCWVLSVRVCRAPAFNDVHLGREYWSRYLRLAGDSPGWSWRRLYPNLNQRQSQSKLKTPNRNWSHCNLQNKKKILIILNLNPAPGRNLRGVSRSALLSSYSLSAGARISCDGCSWGFSRRLERGLPNLPGPRQKSTVPALELETAPRKVGLPNHQRPARRIVACFYIVVGGIT